MMTIIHLREGKAYRSWAVWNKADILMAIGVLKLPATG